MVTGEVFNRLRAQGITIAATAEGLRVTPRRLLTPALREELRACKAELLALLRGMPATPDGALPLWLWDRLYPLPGVAPAAAPADLADGEVADRVAEARAQAATFVEEYRRRFERPPPVPLRPRPVATWPAVDPELRAGVLVAGERLGWPALLLRPGERLAEGEACWRRFVAAAPADLLADAERVLAGTAGCRGTVVAATGAGILDLYR